MPRKLPNTLYLSLVAVDAESAVPLYRQIYQGLRDAIVAGRLAAGTKLPSTRDLATIWHVSRNTLRNAFDQLIAEGYLEAIVGRGTFVAAAQVRQPAQQKVEAKERIRQISNIGRYLEPFGRNARHPRTIGRAFAAGVPDRQTFPHAVWSRILNRCQRRQQYGGFERAFKGIEPLREAIASYLVSARGVRCSAEQIDIVPGAVSGLLVTTLALLDSGDQAWVENPGYINATGLIRYRGAETIPVPVDDEGLVVQAGIARAPNARLAYVTPSHQYPLGVTMSLARRQQLLAWAADNHAWIIEDDYDSEFRYDGPPITALQGLDADQRVIYMGTFSKVMFPSLRLGYVVLPPDLVDVYTGSKLPLALQAPTLLQAAVAEFMLEGHFVRHIRAMRKHYQACRDALVAAVDRHLAGAMTLGATDCGMHVVGYLSAEISPETLLAAAHKLDMAFTSLANHYIAPPQKAGIIIGFANVQPEEIDSYFARLAASL